MRLKSLNPQVFACTASYSQAAHHQFGGEAPPTGFDQRACFDFVKKHGTGVRAVGAPLFLHTNKIYTD